MREHEARPAFERAIADDLRARRGVDALHGEVTYALTPLGQRTLHDDGRAQTA